MLSFIHRIFTILCDNKFENSQLRAEQHEGSVCQEIPQCAACQVC